MAISLKEARKAQQDKVDEPFSNDESTYLNELEKFIDSQIIEQFEHSEVVNIEMAYVKLRTPIGLSNIHDNIPNYRREKMYYEIVKRYKAAGWSTDVDMDDGRSMSSYEYFVLKPKK